MPLKIAIRPLITLLKVKCKNEVMNQKQLGELEHSRSLYLLMPIIHLINFPTHKSLLSDHIDEEEYKANNSPGQCNR